MNLGLRPLEESILPAQTAIQIDHAVFASVSAILAALGTDAQGNATITANANETVTVDHVSATLLAQHADAFQLK